MYVEICELSVCNLMALFLMKRILRNINQKKNLRVVAFIVFIIGGLISVPTFIIGLEQEGSWLICQIGAILFCLTIIISFILEMMFVSKKSEWEAKQGKSTTGAKITMLWYTLYILFFSLLLVIVILTMIIH